MKRLIITLFTALTLSAASAWGQNLQLPVTYGDEMVLQREMPVKISGRAAAGSKVSVELAPATDAKREKAVKVNAKAGEDGRFVTQLPAREAGGPYTLTISAGNETRTFHNVYVGEVWICSGQSNMELRVRETNTAKQDLDMADGLTRVHLYNMKSAWPLYADIWDDKRIAASDEGRFIQPARWEKCSATAAKEFSAIGFHFARILADSLRCHVGIISNAVGGATTEGWIDSLSLRARVPEMLEGDWLENRHIMKWARDRAKYNLQNTNARKHAHPYAPGYLFHAAVRPLEGYTARGILWYQGESNADLVKMHERLFPLLEESWRKEWNAPQMPFYFVQLSSISTRKTWPEFRNSQRLMADSLQNTYMTVSSDVGDSLDVHPRNKRVVGMRMANQALYHTYGFTHLLPEGPKPLRVEAESTGTVRITFDHADRLRFIGKADPHYFELKGRAGDFFPADHVKIEGNSVVVRSSRITRPMYLRYAWKPFTRACLINRMGMPCSTFETKVHHKKALN